MVIRELTTGMPSSPVRVNRLPIKYAKAGTKTVSQAREGGMMCWDGWHDGGVEYNESSNEKTPSHDIVFYRVKIEQFF